MAYSILCSSLEETEKLARRFALSIGTTGAFVSMSGVTGAGKTAFVQYVCRYLGVKETVTSPSFVILNEYKTGRLPVYHFDLYRLEDEGVSTIINELEEYSECSAVTFAEWSEFGREALPFDRIELNVKYKGETAREYSFDYTGGKSGEIIRRMQEL